MELKNDKKTHEFLMLHGIEKKNIAKFFNVKINDIKVNKRCLSDWIMRCSSSVEDFIKITDFIDSEKGSAFNTQEISKLTGKSESTIRRWLRCFGYRKSENDRKRIVQISNEDQIKVKSEIEVFRYCLNRVKKNHQTSNKRLYGKLYRIRGFYADFLFKTVFNKNIIIECKGGMYNAFEGIAEMLVGEFELKKYGVIKNVDSRWLFLSNPKFLNKSTYKRKADLLKSFCKRLKIKLILNTNQGDLE